MFLVVSSSVLVLSSIAVIKLEVKNLPVGGDSLVVQWLGLHASTAGGTGSIPCRGAKIPHAARYGQKIKNKIKYILEKKSYIKKKIFLLASQ